MHRDGSSSRRVITTYAPIDLPGSENEKKTPRLEVKTDTITTTELVGGRFASSTCYTDSLKVRLGRRVVETAQPLGLTSWDFADGAEAQWDFSSAEEVLEIVRDPFRVYETQRCADLLQSAVDSFK